MNTALLREQEKITREEMVELLNEDLAREYQAIIAYTVYSQVLKGAAYTDIARELQSHAGEELAHALLIAKQVDYLGGTPTVTPKSVRVSNRPEEMLRFDLENERELVPPPFPAPLDLGHIGRVVAGCCLPYGQLGRPGLAGAGMDFVFRPWQAWRRGVSNRVCGWVGVCARSLLLDRLNSLSGR